jgi:hypothetical protein
MLGSTPNEAQRRDTTIKQQEKGLEGTSSQSKRVRLHLTLLLFSNINVFI